MHTMLPLTKGHLSHKDRTVNLAEGMSPLKGYILLYYYFVGEVKAESVLPVAIS